ncbi:MAG: DUF1127 domain-containing protein [Hyphomicrobiales bacterium]|uniref:DUF1127 domain-containing protein n=1 Tax=Aestuariivirga sp. TaxID=2650926 RepID=UPI0035AE4A1E
MTTLPLALPFTSRLGRGLASLLHPVRRSRAIAELSALDERLLRDIGLSRLDVDDMRRMW